MKKQIISVVALFALSMTSFTFAGDEYDTSTSSTVNNEFTSEPLVEDYYGIEVELKNGDVRIEWNPFKNKYNDFKYYKVIRSSTVENPFYPQQGAIHYEPNLENTKYIDYNPSKGTNYYRICAITSENLRICSNVKKVYFEKTDYNDESSTSFCTMEYNPVCGRSHNKCPDGMMCAQVMPEPKTYSNKCMLKSAGADYLYHGKCKSKNDSTVTNHKKDYNKTDYKKVEYKNTTASTYYKKNKASNISSKLRKNSDVLVNRLVSKVEKKYSDNEKRIVVLKGIITKLENLAEKRPKLKELVSYIVTKLEEKIKSYDDFGLSEIESIFSDY